MVKDIWNRDPFAWRDMPLLERLEWLRKFNCTGPCGQSSTVLGNRAALEQAIKQATARIAELEAALANTTVAPWEARANELRSAEGPYCDFAAWDEWIGEWNSRQKYPLNLDMDSIGKITLFAAFCDALQLGT